MVTNKRVRQGIYERLNVASVTSLLAAGSASIHHAVAPTTGAYPLVVFNKQAGTQVQVFGAEAFRNTLWVVKAIARGKSASAAEDIDKAIFDRLNFQTITITGAATMYLARESDVEFAETQGDDIFHHVGGLYRLSYQDT